MAKVKKEGKLVKKIVHVKVSRLKDASLY